jgi:hypothetical protein
VRGGRAEKAPVVVSEKRKKGLEKYWVSRNIIE